MMIDFRSMDDNAVIEADLCVVGSGAAGLAIAMSLIGTHHNICIIESGGLGFEALTQMLYQGEATGVPWGTTPIGSRLRYFGGTSNHWGGGCVALDELDFHERPWVPHSGWPITRKDLNPWYERVRHYLHLEEGPIDNDNAKAVAALPFQFDTAKLVHRSGRSSLQPRLGTVHRAEIERASNIRVYLHANLMEFVPNEAGTTITEARLRSLDGKNGSVRARYFVLACGGIENARLLLLSNSVVPEGIGNTNGLVGRFFMDHPSGRIGVIASDTPARLSDPYNRMVDVPGVVHTGDPSLTGQIQAANRTLNARMRPQDYEDISAIPDGVAAVRAFESGLHSGAFEGGLTSVVWRIASDLGDVVPAVYRRVAGKPVVQLHHIDLEGFFEQAPNPDSRVTLTDTRDALGQRQVRLDWRMTDLDMHTFRTAADIFGAEIARLGLGRLRIEPWLRPGATEPPRLSGVAHHMGTTRMSDDPKTGVVNADCRVHGIDNLYVAGGSVFATGGRALPTFTIVALATRLADHLNTQLATE